MTSSISTILKMLMENSQRRRKTINLFVMTTQTEIRAFWGERGGRGELAAALTVCQILICKHKDRELIIKVLKQAKSPCQLLKFDDSMMNTAGMLILA